MWVTVLLLASAMAFEQVAFGHLNLWKVELNSVWDVSLIHRASLQSNSTDLLRFLVPSQYMLGSNTYSLLHFH